MANRLNDQINQYANEEPFLSIIAAVAVGVVYFGVLERITMWKPRPTIRKRFKTGSRDVNY